MSSRGAPKSDEVICLMVVLIKRSLRREKAPREDKCIKRSFRSCLPREDRIIIPPIQLTDNRNTA